jgi:tRNA (guanine37-N1)-methyltransferase
VLNLKKGLKKVLFGTIPQHDLVHISNSYDIIGDIAIIRLNKKTKQYVQVVADSVMHIHNNVKTVLVQKTPVQGDYRLRTLEYVAGLNKTITVHKEFGCSFSVDVEKCYFSPRLSFERTRIVKKVENGEVIVNMFAGVGSFSIVIAKHSNASKVFSIDLNPIAIKYMEKNVRLNRVYGTVVPIKGDAKSIIIKQLNNVADRVLMPLPKIAFEYLRWALLALKKRGGWIHYYDFVHARKKELFLEKVKLKVEEKLVALETNFDIPSSRIVRTVGPNWYQIVLDIVVE